MRMDEKHGNFLLRVYELYNRYGIKSVTMDDVARELGISKKTLYETIEDKSELVKHVMEMVYRYHGVKLNEITTRGLNAIEELFEVNRYMTQMVKEHNPTLGYDMQKYYPELHKALMQEQRQRMHDAIRLNLTKGIEEGLYRKEMNVEIISKLHMTRMEYRYRQDSFQLNDIDSQEVMREIFIYHLHGIANENGIKILNEKLNAEWK
ncbi:MAG: TetR/AcrR family transcriptional regulator [Porphyromonadaceae bacterium]|nr:MAG: TetR/AcrR family transcriptional regulator [Porphyromonadaceae bacterium]